MFESLVILSVALGAEPPATAPARVPAAEALVVSASLPASPLAPGASLELEVRIEPGDGWSASTAGVPGVVLQIDPPPSVRLEGAVLTAPRDLARNGFLHAPYERLVEGSSTHVPFTLDSAPAEGARIGLVVCAYLRGSDGTTRFERRRVELPVAAGAASVPGDPTDSTWGGGTLDVVAIGEKAPPFELPRADGTTVALETFEGRSRVLVTTYRAFW